MTPSEPVTTRTGGVTTGLSTALQVAVLDVAVLRWPEESVVLAGLREAGTPRLLLVVRTVRRRGCLMEAH
ncbi:MAG: hypothetical protein ACR2MO_01195 [Acidimicrobiales bacterium]